MHLNARVALFLTRSRTANARTLRWTMCLSMTAGFTWILVSLFQKSSGKSKVRTEIQGGKLLDTVKPLFTRKALEIEWASFRDGLPLRLLVQTKEGSFFSR